MTRQQLQKANALDDKITKLERLLSDVPSLIHIEVRDSGNGWPLSKVELKEVKNILANGLKNRITELKTEFSKL